MDGRRLAFLELLSEPKKAFSSPFSPRSPQLAISVIIILTPMTPLEARDVSGAVSSFISGTGLALANKVSVSRSLPYLASMTRAGEGEQSRHVVTWDIRVALQLGGCLRSGSRASRARHLVCEWSTKTAAVSSVILFDFLDPTLYHLSPHVWVWTVCIVSGATVTHSSSWPLSSPGRLGLFHSGTF